MAIPIDTARLAGKVGDIKEYFDALAMLPEEARKAAMAEIAGDRKKQYGAM
jgi:uncharacterized protein YdbL (DUF1318 family)